MVLEAIHGYSLEVSHFLYKNISCEYLLEVPRRDVYNLQFVEK